MNTADKEQAGPITAPLLARLVAAKQAREEGVPAEPLNPEVYADLGRAMQHGIDHIARRDRQWTDVMDGFFGTVYGSRP